MLLLPGVALATPVAQAVDGSVAASAAASTWTSDLRAAQPGDVVGPVGARPRPGQPEGAVEARDVGEVLGAVERLVVRQVLRLVGVALAGGHQAERPVVLGGQRVARAVQRGQHAEQVEVLRRPLAEAEGDRVARGLLADQVKGVALRSMKAPGTAYDDPVLGKDPQPAHMRDYVRTYQDNGGVHINSGIPNHAFYQTAMAIGGYAWDKSGRIWYETLRDPRLRPNASFARFANLTVDVAGRLYGSGSSEQKAVRHGWSEVGIRVSR